MNRTYTGFKRYAIAAIIFVLSLILAFTIVRTPITASAAEDTEYFTEPDPVALSVSNLQFSDSSGSAPASPTGWTGSGLGGLDAGNVVSGVVDLTANAYAEATEDEDVYKLSRYPEYKSAVPSTPFGPGSKFPNTNKKVLMINTAGSESAYGYTSQSVSFVAGGFYRVSVYVKTGDFADGKGATVKLTGLPEEVAFKNINTVNNLEKDSSGNPVLNEKNLYGFKQYNFYVAAPAQALSTVSISLQVGDRALDGEEVTYYNPADGYAFFDNIVAERIGANAFYSAVEDISKIQNSSAQYMVKDFTENVDRLTKGDISHFYTGEEDSDATDIGSFNGGMDGWEYVTDVEDAVAKGHVALAYNTVNTFSSDNEFGFTSRPMSPIGNRDGNSNILVISSPKEKVAVGYRSPSYTVLRNTYYRIGYWVNTQEINGGAGATAVIRGTNGISGDENKLVVTATGLSGDSAETMRYGWKQYWFYIKGSVLKDYEISLEFWLGQPNSVSSGIAMFDEVTVEKISTADYSTYSSGGTLVTFDPSFPDTGISNGLFYNTGNYEEYGYPMVPENWSKITPSDAETTGFSTAEVKSAEDAVSGIICTDIEHFDANRADYNYVQNPAPNSGNMLMMSSLTDTAFAYRSPSVNVAASTAYRLSVSLKTADVEGYGANLVLKSGNTVISTIEGIKDTNGGFGTYTFYINGGASSQSVSLEIWLGMNDRIDNKSKLASGTLFVNRVEFKAFAEGENFADYEKEYNAARAQGVKNLTAAAYSFDPIGLSAYDYYDSGEVKTAYDWSLNLGNADEVTFGIFDSSTLPMSGRTQIPENFVNKKDESVTGNNVLYLYNGILTYSAIRTNNAVSLAENSYYRISVSVKVDIPDKLKSDENAVGAGIWLSGLDYKFENIKDTSTTVGDITDKETFKTYNFYVKTSSATETYIAISLGDSVYPENKCMGHVYVNDIRVTDIGNAAYESELANFDEKSENYESYIKYNMNVDLADGATDTDNENGDTEGGGEDGEEKPSGELAWWLIPSILFAVAILIAVIGTLIRRLLDKRASKKSVQVVNSYDRRKTLHKMHEAKESGKSPTAPQEDNYEDFDDTLSPAAPEKETKAKRETAEAVDSYDSFDDSDKAPESEIAPAAPAEEATAEETAAVETDSVAETAEETAQENQDAEPADETAASEEKPEEETKTEPEPKTEEKPVKAQKEKKPAAPEQKSGDKYSDDFED